ncbi:type II restriction endonuclease subunit M [Actinomadura sp. NBRC 104412]|uniref:N-6 DNA methylase n=1 Tax=Actinomadura sp. NBRC 104412 TaxID=3032203 RepID=UPI0024A0938A|nr:N-6 DNA methylase [Actinomadura sp. NBRC 104412]GLZ08228.1 type II restriction endonuclease subunit M [Actinomadura sp. NBRC 104412]
MASQSERLTAAEISRLAGVTRATVSNWRRRHPDFPQPIGGTEASPSYDRRQVEAWLDARGRLPARSARDDLRAHLRGRTPRDVEAVALFTAHLARLDQDGRGRIATLDDARLIEVHAGAVSSSSGPVKPSLADVPAALLRSAANVTLNEGPLAVFDVLDEHSEAPIGIRGLHPTPQPIADLMADLATTGGHRVRSVLDPACGGGRLLGAVAARLEPGARVHGQEYRAVTAAQARTRVTEESPKTFVDVRTGDSLRDDAFPELRVDAVVCNPPYGDREWGHDELAFDTRWAYGVPPRSEPELAWVQHALAHLNDGGQAVLLLPPATASRPSGRRIRAELLRQGALCAIIALPAGLAAPHHIGLHLWILRRPEADRPSRGLVLLMDMADRSATTAAPAPDRPSARRAVGPTPGRSAPQDRTRQGKAANQDTLPETIRDTWEAFNAPADFADIPGTARAVPAIDLLDELVDLSPARHVRSAPVISPDAALRHVTELTERLGAQVAAIAEASRIGPWTSAGEAGRTWRSATVADLARGGALAVHRGVRASLADAPPADLADRPVLRARDLIGGVPAGGDARDVPLADPVTIKTGDVLLTQVVGPQGVATRVAEEDDAGCLLGNGVVLLRPDPGRLDPWFLAGFVSAPDNVSQATTGTSTQQLVASRLRVPLLPLDEQTAYGQAFRKVHDLRTSARNAATCANEMADFIATALSGGALLPHEAESP